MGRPTAGLEMSFRMVEVIRAGLVARGVDPRPLFARFGIQDADAKAERRVPHDVGMALLEAAARETKDPRFGMHAAEHYQPGAHVFEYLALNSPTLGIMLERVTRFYRLILDAAEPRLEVDGPVARWHFSMPGLEPIPPVLAELVLSAAVLAGRRWMGVDASPRVRFAFAAPADTGEHRRVLGPDVGFAAATNHLEFPSAALALPLPRANPDLFVLLERHAEIELKQRPQPDDLRARIAQLIGESLESSDTDLPAIAKKLRTSPRTLRRRLSELGTSHRALVDEVRLARARQYLAESRLSLEEVAYLLGFSDASAFHRAFKRWTGDTPADYRSRAREASA